MLSLVVSRLTTKPATSVVVASSSVRDLQLAVHRGLLQRDVPVAGDVLPQLHRLAALGVVLGGVPADEGAALVVQLAVAEGVLLRRVGLAVGALEVDGRGAGAVLAGLAAAAAVVGQHALGLLGGGLATLAQTAAEQAVAVGVLVLVQQPVVVRVDVHVVGDAVAVGVAGPAVLGRLGALAHALGVLLAALDVVVDPVVVGVEVLPVRDAVAVGVPSGEAALLAVGDLVPVVVLGGICADQLGAVCGAAVPGARGVSLLEGVGTGAGQHQAQREQG
jgi:hypothetical protein